MKRTHRKKKTYPVVCLHVGAPLDGLTRHVVHLLLEFALGKLISLHLLVVLLCLLLIHFVSVETWVSSQVVWVVV